MTDSVKVVMEQIDDSTGVAISKVTAEWYGMDRNIANVMSNELTQGLVDRVKGMAGAKLEVTGDDKIKRMLGGDATKKA